MERTLQPLIHVPSDQLTALRAEFVDALWRAIGDAMRWWRARLDRNVFRALPVVEFISSQPAEQYFQDTQDKVLRELAGTWPVGRDGITYVCYGLWGEGPYAARGNVIGASGDYLVVQSSTSLVMFADGSFPGYSGDEPWNSRAAQTGALAHELGHTLGLPHTSDSQPEQAQESIMYAWWSFPRIGLTERERSMALAAIDRDPVP